MSMDPTPQQVSGPAAPAASPMRARVTQCAPGIVAFLGFALIMFPTKPWGERLVYALVGGFLWHWAAYIAVHFAAHVIAKVAGREPNTARLGDATGDVFLGAAALVIVVWFLGVHWTRAQASELEYCVRAEVWRVANYGGQQRSADDIVASCLAEQKPRVTSDDGY